MACSSLKKHKLAKNLTGGEWTILVGTGHERKTFKMHKDLLEKYSGYFEEKKLFSTVAAEKHLILLSDEDPDAFQMFRQWAYTGEVAKAVTEFTVPRGTSKLQIQLREAQLLEDFDNHQTTLINLYCFGEKLGINDLCNRAIDAIQDGYFGYGTVFGPGSGIRIFRQTKKNSKLRDLAVASVVLHMDRGCTKLRAEIMDLCIREPDYFPHMMKWIARKFSLFGRRQREGFDVMTRKGFSVLNREKLCSCWFHEHGPGEAHQGHEACAAPFTDCSHGEDDEIDKDALKLNMNDLDSIYKSFSEFFLKEQKK